MKSEIPILAGSVAALALSVVTTIHLLQQSPVLPQPPLSFAPPIAPSEPGPEPAASEVPPSPAPMVDNDHEAAMPDRAVRRSEITELPTVGDNDRAQMARERVEKPLRELFAAAGLQYPAHRLYIRAFKRERELELWAAPALGAFRLVTVYGIAGASGGPGPKRREGDCQVPEGFYAINRYNPKSNFHLSMGLNYPNESDRILSDREKPGHDIFLHGRASSIGCMALGDDRIEEVYVAATDCPRPVEVHVFPGRMDAPDWQAWREEVVAQRPELGRFWDDLHVGWQIFEQYRLLPEITVLPDGRYQCTAPPHIRNAQGLASSQSQDSRPPQGQELRQ